MKAEENELVQLANKYAGGVKPHAKKIVGVAIVVAVGLLALLFMRQRNQTAAQQSWTSYFAAAAQNDLEGLYDVANRYPRTNAGAWAMQSAGDINLATGTVNMYSDRAEARERLLAAKEDYQKAEQRASDDMLRQRARMGLAQAHEALNELDEAKAVYNRVISQWPDSAIAGLASDRLAVLTNPETSKFYDWFMAQKVEPPKNPLGDLQLDNAEALDDQRNFMQPPDEGLEVEETEVPDAPDAAELDEPAAESTPE